ncbi:MAG: lamin tail domain-containing protein, partial [Calditrichaeota bacterium]|nr:lamin tail domain-containing protein [Calditrichota bacterium]
MTLGSHEFLLVWASKKDRTTGELHTNFSLKKGGEFVGLYASDGTAIDTLTFGEQTDDISLARDVDGSGSFKLTTDPTPAAANHIVSPPTPLPEIVINEFLAGNETINTDEDGEYEDWIELYNAGDDAVDLTGFTITDDPTEPDQ